MASNNSIDQMNEAMAIFYGYKIYDQGTTRCVVNEHGLGHPVSSLRYEESWNWLMPIWIKFKNLNLKNDEYWQWLESLSYYLTTSDEPKRFHERLFYAIEWYNKQLNQKV